jgi:hypothetical protein
MPPPAAGCTGYAERAAITTAEGATTATNRPLPGLGGMLIFIRASEQNFHGRVN